MRNSRIVENCTTSVQLAEPMRTRKKENMWIDEVVEKVDAKVGVNLYFILIDILLHCPMVYIYTLVQRFTTKYDQDSIFKVK